MLANLPVELILLICQYPEPKELRQLARTNSRMMQIIKKYLPTALEREILFYLYYQHNGKREGRICLFNSYACSVEVIAKFHNCYETYQVATTQNKIFGISGNEAFEIYDLNTRRISGGSYPPEWRGYASVAYFKDKLYYLGGKDPKTWEYTNRVNVLIDGEWQTGPAFPLPIYSARPIVCDGILYVFCGLDSNKIYRLSDDEREWVEVGEKELYWGYVVASLDGRIYITGGQDGGALKSCLCFDPSAPVGSRISRIADMNYASYYHSLIVTNGKLYAIGGKFQYTEKKRYGSYTGINLCDTIEEYDPQTNKWREVGKINIK